MKGMSVSVEAASIQSVVRNANTRSAVFDRHLLIIGLWIFAGYYLGCKIGFALTFQPHPVSVLWPPNSVLVAALLLTPPRSWWVVLLAALPAHLAAQLQSHVPPLMIFCWFLSNSCEALIGAGLMRYLVGGPIRFITLRNVGLFCLCVVFIAPFLSSFLDAALVVWNHWGKDTYWELIRVRLFSNALAALIIVPLVVTWATTGIQPLRTARLSRYLEASALFVGLLLVSYAVLYKFGSGTDSALLFLPLPFLLWAAVRFGSLGASTAVSIVGFLAIWSAAHGHGPFSGGPAEQDALSIQIFLIVLAIPLLFLATVIEERATGATELGESESRFRNLADAAHVLIWMAGVDKLCTFFNKPWLEFTGRSIEQEMGNGWADGVHREDLQKCLKTYTEAFDARKPFVMQYRLKRNDGEYRRISDEGVPRYDADGTFAGYIGSCVDVTDLITKEQALHDSNERIDLATKGAGLIVWTWDIPRDEVWFSEKDRALLGLSPSEKLTAKRVRSVIHPDDREFVRQLVEKSLKTDEELEGEYRIVLGDGRVRWVTRRGRVEFDGDGNPICERGVLMDITDVVKNKEALREFEGRVVLAAKAAHLGVWELDIATNEVWMSDSARELFQFPLEGEISYDEFEQRVHPEDRAMRRSAVNHAIETEGEYAIEYRVLLRDGNVRWLEGRGRCLPVKHGKGHRLVCVSV